MKIKEEIENLKDLRRYLWISVIGIVGGLSMLFLNTTIYRIGWLIIPKLIIIVTGILLAILFLKEIMNFNKKINKLLNKLKEE